MRTGRLGDRGMEVVMAGDMGLDWICGFGYPELVAKTKSGYDGCTPLEDVGRVICQRTAMKCLSRHSPLEVDQVPSVQSILISILPPVRSRVFPLPSSPDLYQSLHVVDRKRCCTIDMSTDMILVP